MPAKKSKAKKAKKPTGPVSRELLYKEDLQEYGKVTAILGNCRMSVMLPDNSTRLAHVRGAQRKRVWYCLGDVVLASYREFEPDKVDLIHKYTPEEVRKLHKQHEIPESFLEGADPNALATDTGIVFDGDDDEPINIDDI